MALPRRALQVESVGPVCQTWTPAMAAELLLDCLQHKEVLNQMQPAVLVCTAHPESHAEVCGSCCSLQQQHSQSSC